MNELLQNVFIYKEALKMLFGIDCEGMRALLVEHVVNHTLPIHGLTGRVLEFHCV